MGHQECLRECIKILDIILIRHRNVKNLILIIRIENDENSLFFFLRVDKSLRVVP
jgi:hypothetical protein